MCGASLPARAPHQSAPPAVSRLSFPNANNVRSLAAWLWLIDLGTAKRVLDASDDSSGELAAALAQHFDEVHAVRADALQLDALRGSNERQGWSIASLVAGSAGTLQQASGTFDCIVVHDVLARRNLNDRDFLAELSQYHRLLRVDGWFAMAAFTPSEIGSDNLPAGTLPKRRAHRLLSRAGFRDLRFLWVENSLDRPLSLIPDTLSARTAYESYDAMRGSSTFIRRMAALAGLGSVLYPSYFLLARR